MLRRYLDGAMRRARYEILPDDGTFYGEIPDFDGVYAKAPTPKGCRDELAVILEKWFMFRTALRLPVPKVD
jgi:predicted RNase H-like HicB family nuclease